MTPHIPATAPYMPRPSKLAQLNRIGGFWRELLDRNRLVGLRDQLEKLSRQGRFRGFEVAAGRSDKRAVSIGPWDDSDVFKWVEAASLALLIDKDPVLETMLDGIVDLIVAGQDETGYIDTRHYSLGRPRWDVDNGNNHVLYNLGHLIEAGIAHSHLASDSRLFACAVRVADCIERSFGPGKLEWAPQHQEIELALIRLYEETGQRRYLGLANYFLERRGHHSGRTDLGYFAQDHVPVVDQHEIVGHTVRALYQNIAVHDVAQYLGNSAFKSAQNDMWEDMTSGKLLISGGAGRVHEGAHGIEGFRAKFDLASDEPDVDTCTSIAILLWAQRLLASTDEPRFADMVEHQMYNRILAGASLSQTEWFYGMPLESVAREGFDGIGGAGPVMGASEHYRQPWCRVPCCPPNFARVVATFPMLALRVSSHTLTVDQFVDLEETVEVNGQSIKVSMVTGYPHHGDVSIRLEMPEASHFTLRLRMPGWVNGQVMGGNLYRSRVGDQCTVEVDGSLISDISGVLGYIVLDRKWEAETSLVFRLPLQARPVTACYDVAALRGQTALMVGPLVYCAEGDPLALAATSVADLAGSTTSPHPFLPVPQLRAQSGLSLVPLYAWDNAQPAGLKVWFLR